MCLKTTMAKMLNSEVINVTSFARLHVGEDDVVELRDGHWSNFGLLLSKLEDVEVIKLAEIIKTMVRTCRILIRCSASATKPCRTSSSSKDLTGVWSVEVVVTE